MRPLFAQIKEAAAETFRQGDVQITSAGTVVIGTYTLTFNEVLGYILAASNLIYVWVKIWKELKKKQEAK